MGIALLIVLIASFALIVWILICNEITYNHRLALLSGISNDARQRIEDGRSDYMDNYSVLSTVTYNDHVFALVIFRDPRKLYPTEVQGFM